MSSTKFVFFRLIGKTRWPPRALIGWDTFDIFSETTEGNATKLDRKQDLNVLYQVCVFRADRKTKMAVPASHWLRHYWLLLWNRWTEWEETWQEARSLGPLSSLCFSGRSEKQDGRHCLWFAETFLAFPLKLLKGIWWNLTGSKISMSSSKFVFFRPIGKSRWLPWPLIGGDTYTTTLVYIVAQQTKFTHSLLLKYINFWIFEIIANSELSLFVYCVSEIKLYPGVFIYWYFLLFRFALQIFLNHNF